MDWPTVTVAAHIAAEPQRVWDLVSDIGLMQRFSDELQSVQSGISLGRARDFPAPTSTR